MLRTIIKLLGATFAVAMRAYPANACPLVLPLDESMAAPSSFGDYLTRDTTYFMLVGLADGRDGAVIDHGDRWTVDCESLPPELVQSVRDTLAFDGTVDGRRVREVFEANYLGTIAQRGQRGIIKNTEAELRAITNFTAWPTRTVAFSAIKRKSRRIYRSPEGFLPVTSVSQTLDSETGDQDADVLETEVGVKRTDSEDWDFYAYNQAGELSEYSTFPAGERPSPRICINCHYDAGTRAVERFFP